MPKNARVTAKPSRKKNREAPRPKRIARAGGRTDWARVDEKTDAQIARDIATDADATEFTDEMFVAARWSIPAKRTQIALKVDPEVLAFFKAPGPGYQTRMNAVLRAYMERAKANHK